jgi:hypothetical protein
LHHQTQPPSSSKHGLFEDLPARPPTPARLRPSPALGDLDVQVAVSSETSRRALTCPPRSKTARTPYARCFADPTVVRAENYLFGCAYGIMGYVIHGFKLN